MNLKSIAAIMLLAVTSTPMARAAESPAASPTPQATSTADDAPAAASPAAATPADALPSEPAPPIADAQAPPPSTVIEAADSPPAPWLGLVGGGVGALAGAVVGSVGEIALFTLFGGPMLQNLGAAGTFTILVIAPAIPTALGALIGGWVAKDARAGGFAAGGAAIGAAALGGLGFTIVGLGGAAAAGGELTGISAALALGVCLGVPCGACLGGMGGAIAALAMDGAMRAPAVVEGSPPTRTSPTGDARASSTMAW